MTTKNDKAGEPASAPAKNGGAGELFRTFAHCSAEAVGTPWAFLGAFLLILAWGVSGPLFSFSDTWQLVINTTTTIVTFLMVFLIQNSQNRDSKAVHLKLDELIRSVSGARDRLVDLEKLSDEELKEFESEFAELHERACRAKTRQDTISHQDTRSRQETN